jgi:1-pyrroline-5-carboxylate dehydrogenase
MKFQNENTWLWYIREKKEEEFHKKYDTAIASIKVNLNLGKTYPNYINGVEKSSSKGVFAVTSPIDTRIVAGYFQKSTKEDVREAISAAKAAFPKWKFLSWQDRIRILRVVADKLAERKFDFAATIGMENGKTRLEAMGEVDEAIDVIRYYCNEVESNDGYEVTMGQAYANEFSKSILKPYGVWGVIGPFNFPLAIPVCMSVGAMVTGNTAVFKPSSDTPLTMYRFTEIIHEVEIPAGVFNFVTGSGSEVGAEIISNDDVSGIAFTGSKAVGYMIAREFTARKPRPVITEMGGKNPIIVTSRADLDKAVEGVLISAFGYGGQKCSACSRVLVFENVKERFMTELVERTKALKIGDPAGREIFLGPIINKSAYEKYQSFIDLARKDGKILAGGKILKDGVFAYGFYVEPTIVDGLQEDHKLMNEELFVPILCTKSVRNLEEAVHIANSTEYGLTAGIFSEDQKEIQYFFDNIQAGVTYANRRIGGTTGAMIGAQPFGGWKASGSTGKGTGGKYYLLQFLREQAQTVVS